MNEEEVKRMKLANFMLGNHDIKVIKLFSRPHPTYNFDIFQSGRYQVSVKIIAKTKTKASTNSDAFLKSFFINLFKTLYFYS